MLRIQHWLRVLSGACAGLAVWISPADAGQWTFSGQIAPELRGYIDPPEYGKPKDPLILELQRIVRTERPNFFFPFTGQDSQRMWPSIAGDFTVEYEWNAGADKIVFMPFGRLADNDDRRTHADLREGHWLHVRKNWDAVVGVSKVFWGVTESRHLVDIVNQDDQVEDINGEVKLGQPMVNGNIFGEWGRLSLFYLPYFRERTFEANNARFRGPLPIDVDAAIFESDLEQWHPDFAARYETTWRDLDVGLSAFHGTSREPGYDIEFRQNGVFTVPTYGILTQIGLDALYTRGNWLWKVEAISRWGPGDDYGAAVGGFEYTFHNLFNTSRDVGLLLEYNYDGRRKPPPAIFPFDQTTTNRIESKLRKFARNPSKLISLVNEFGDVIDNGRIEYNGGVPPAFFDDDIYVGARLTFNDEKDTNVLVGAIIDVEEQGTYLQIEATRRLDNNWSLELDGSFFIDVPKSDTPLFFVSSDSFVQVQLFRYF